MSKKDETMKSKKQKTTTRPVTIEELKTLAECYDHNSSNVFDACGIEKEDMFLLIKKTITADVTSVKKSKMVELIEKLVDIHPMGVRMLILAFVMNIQSVSNMMNPLEVVKTVAEARHSKEVAEEKIAQFKESLSSSPASSLSLLSDIFGDSGRS